VESLSQELKDSRTAQIEAANESLAKLEESEVRVREAEAAAETMAEEVEVFRMKVVASEAKASAEVAHLQKEVRDVRER